MLRTAFLALILLVSSTSSTSLLRKSIVRRQSDPQLCHAIEGFECKCSYYRVTCTTDRELPSPITVSPNERNKYQSVDLVITAARDISVNDQTFAPVKDLFKTDGENCEFRIKFEKFTGLHLTSPGIFNRVFPDNLSPSARKHLALEIYNPDVPPNDNPSLFKNLNSDAVELYALYPFKGSFQQLFDGANIKYLRLSGGDIRSDPSQSFTGNIGRLELAKQASELSVQNFPVYPAHELAINAFYVDNFNSPHPPNYNNLGELRVHSNGRIPADAFRNYPNIHTLQISTEQDIDPQALNGLNNLEKLIIKDTKIPIEFLKNLPNLKEYETSIEKLDEKTQCQLIEKLANGQLAVQTIPNGQGCTCISAYLDNSIGRNPCDAENCDRSSCAAIKNNYNVQTRTFNPPPAIRRTDGSDALRPREQRVYSSPSQISSQDQQKLQSGLPHQPPREEPPRYDDNQGQQYPPYSPPDTRNPYSGNQYGQYNPYQNENSHQDHRTQNDYNRYDHSQQQNENSNRYDHHQQQNNNYNRYDDQHGQDSNRYDHDQHIQSGHDQQQNDNSNRYDHHQQQNNNYNRYDDQHGQDSNQYDHDQHIQSGHDQQQNDNSNRYDHHQQQNNNYNRYDDQHGQDSNRYDHDQRTESGHGQHGQDSSRHGHDQHGQDSSRHGHDQHGQDSNRYDHDQHTESGHGQHSQDSNQYDHDQHTGSDHGQHGQDSNQYGHDQHTQDSNRPVHEQHAESPHGEHSQGSDQRDHDQDSNRPNDSQYIETPIENNDNSYNDNSNRYNDDSYTESIHRDSGNENFNQNDNSPFSENNQHEHNYPTDNNNEENSFNNNYDALLITTTTTEFDWNNDRDLTTTTYSYFDEQHGDGHDGGDGGSADEGSNNQQTGEGNENRQDGGENQSDGSQTPAGGNEGQEGPDYPYADSGLDSNGTDTGPPSKKGMSWLPIIIIVAAIIALLLIGLLVLFLRKKRGNNNNQGYKQASQGEQGTR